MPIKLSPGALAPEGLSPGKLSKRKWLSRVGATKNFLAGRAFSVWLVVLCALALFGSGCGGGPSFTLAMAGLPNANPDATGRPSPVMIQMYELRSDLLFKQAEMLPLFSDPVGALGADLVAYDEMTILPGQAYVLEYEPTPETKFVGVMASFRQSAAKGPWKVIVPINPEGQSKIGLELNSASLVLIPPDKVKKWDPAETVANYRETSRTLAPSANAPVTPTYPNDQAPLSPGQVESASENLLEVNPSRVFEYPPEPEALPLPESPQTTKTLKKAKTVSEQ